MARIPGAVLLAVLALAGASQVLAAGGMQPSTTVVHQGTAVFTDMLPCVNASYEFTVTYRTTVVHVPATASGTETGTFVEVATFDAVPAPANASLPSFRGHFAAHGRIRSDAATATNIVIFTESIDATGSDGSVIHFHDNTHATFTDGTLVAGFAKAFCK